MYIVIELQTDKTGHVSSILTEHATQQEAESKYHAVLSAAAVSEIPVHSCIIVSNEAFPVKYQCYKNL